MKKRTDFLSLLKPYKGKILIAVLAMLMANLCGLVFPWALKVIIDEILPQKNAALFNILTISLFAVFILKFCFGFVREYVIACLGEKVIYDLRSLVYWQLQRLSVEYVENTSVGEIVSKIIGDVESIRDYLFGGIIDFICSFFEVFFVFSILLYLNWKLTLIALIYLPVFVIAFLKLNPRLKERHCLIREKFGELTSCLHEMLNGIRIVAGFKKESYEADKFKKKQQDILKNELKGHKLSIFLWMGAEFISSLGLITFLWFGVKGVFSGEISVGTLMAFYSYLGIIFYPVIKMAIVNNYYQQATASMERINRILERTPLIQDVKHPIKLNRIKGDVLFQGVDFSYEGNNNVLNDINLPAAASEVIALVGKSGAGKTTLISLLLRFYDPSKGAVFIDGHNLKDLELAAYRANIAMVLQDDYLFSATIKENICYGNPQAQEEQIIAAAEAAHAHLFIAQLPQGYDTHIGERGVKLSFGQRQRISIARALLRDPAILILDEATSCVDSQTERLIVDKAYKNLMAGRTTFVIAHRLSTITTADRIVVIDHGRITETGNHIDLLKKKGEYWKMWTEQYPQQPAVLGV
ncbi:MAG: ABC transporter ATP-binding protein [Candidatus Omnitrophota bacterium]